MHENTQAWTLRIHIGFLASNAGREGFFTFSNFSHWFPGIAKLIFEIADYVVTGGLKILIN
jgi:hypothetical protein